MTTWVLTPMKAPADCKTRLSPALEPHARTALVRAMLGHVAAAVQAAAGVDAFVLIGPDRHGLSPAVRRLDDPGGGLNAALAAGLAAALAAGVTRLIVLAGDLPQLTHGDVEALAGLGAGVVGLAPDRRGLGTNALSLPLPQAADFRFHYGEHSFAAHRAEAERLGLPIAAIRSATLGLDVDEPADLADLAVAEHVSEPAAPPTRHRQGDAP